MTWQEIDDQHDEVSPRDPRLQPSRSANATVPLRAPKPFLSKRDCGLVSVGQLASNVSAFGAHTRKIDRSITAREGGSDSAAAADCGRSRSPIGALAAPGLEEPAPRSMGGGMTTRQPGRLRFGATAARERDSPPDFTNPALSHRRDRPDVAFDLPSSRGVHRRHEPRGRHAPSRAPSAVGRPCRTSRPPAPAAVAGSLGPRWSSGG